MINDWTYETDVEAATEAAACANYERPNGTPKILYVKHRYYFGVMWNYETGKWWVPNRSRNGVTVNLGPFDSDDAAAIAFDLDCLEMGRESALNSYYLFDVYCNCLCGLYPSVAVLPSNMPTTQLLPSTAPDSSSHDGPHSPDMPSQSSPPSFSPSPDPRYDHEVDPLPDDLFSYDDALSTDLSQADPPDSYGYARTPANPNPSQRPPLIDFLALRRNQQALLYPQRLHPLLLLQACGYPQLHP
jgi:hypothetical protein